MANHPAVSASRRFSLGSTALWRQSSKRCFVDSPTRQQRLKALSELRIAIDDQLPVRHQEAINRIH
ncbi:MAG: hypothetical protein ACJAQ3_002105, partial [Planctomycetota bacterium]